MGAATEIRESSLIRTSSDRLNARKHIASGRGALSVNRREWLVEAARIIIVSAAAVQTGVAGSG